MKVLLSIFFILALLPIWIPIFLVLISIGIAREADKLFEAYITRI